MLKNHFNIEIVYALKRLISLYSLSHILRSASVCVCVNVPVPNHITWAEDVNYLNNKVTDEKKLGLDMDMYGNTLETKAYEWMWTNERKNQLSEHMQWNASKLLSFLGLK